MENQGIKELVSVIVPVYNVQDCLDDCIRSLVGQTYRNIEILLIDDGSTDDSGRICASWVSCDTRIHYYKKNNEGLGPTREYGVQRAKGEFFAFVDSDDWVEAHYVELLHRAVLEEDADMAECEFCRISQKTGEKSIGRVNGVMGKPYTKEQRIRHAMNSQWKILFRREFYVKHSFAQPRIPFEDQAVYALEVACAKRIASVNQPLYYYRKHRGSSITSHASFYFQAHRAMQYLIDGFKREGVFDTYSQALKQELLQFTYYTLSQYPLELNMLEHQRLRETFAQVLRNNFPDYSDETAMVWGSYNLAKIVSLTGLMEDAYQRFSFSSIVSLISLMPEELVAEHPNRYRRRMIQRELQHRFWEQLREEKPHYLILDFIEERHDLIEKDGVILTKSDALEESDFSFSGWRLILRDSEECKMLWEKACLAFIAELKKYFLPQQVILVANTLAERYGRVDQLHEYENIQQIRKTNAILRGYYDFFCEHFAGVQMVDETNDALYATDEHFEYGCYPWHLNEWINEKIAKQMRCGKL